MFSLFLYEMHFHQDQCHTGLAEPTGFPYSPVQKIGWRPTTRQEHARERKALRHSDMTLSPLCHLNYML